MTVNEATRALNLSSPDVVYRLLRSGVLRGRKVRRSWEIDDASVQERIARVRAKRSSRLHAEEERARRRAEVEAMFA